MWLFLVAFCLDVFAFVTEERVLASVGSTSCRPRSRSLRRVKNLNHADAASMRGLIRNRLINRVGTPPIRSQITHPSSRQIRPRTISSPPFKYKNRIVSSEKSTGTKKRTKSPLSLGRFIALPPSSLVQSPAWTAFKKFIFGEKSPSPHVFVMLAEAPTPIEPGNARRQNYC